MPKVNLYEIAQSISYEGLRMPELSYACKWVDLQSFDASQVRDTGWFRLMASEECGNHNASTYLLNQYVYRRGEKTLVFENADECLVHQRAQTTS